MGTYYRYVNRNYFYYIDNYLNQNRHVLKVLAVPLVKWSKKLKSVTDEKEKHETTKFVIKEWTTCNYSAWCTDT